MAVFIKARLSEIKAFAYSELRRYDVNAERRRELHELVAGRTRDSTLIIENTGSQRGVLLSGYNRLSRLEDWPYPEAVEVFRLDN